MKWVAGYATNTALGLPGIHAVVVVNDPETGIPTAMLDGGPITAERTAAVSGVALRHFGPPRRGRRRGRRPRDRDDRRRGPWPVAPRRLRRPPAGCRAADLRPITGASGGPRRRGSLDPRHRLGGGQGTAREAVDGAHVVFTAARPSTGGRADDDQRLAPQGRDGHPHRLRDLLRRGGRPGGRAVRGRPARAVPRQSRRRQLRRLPGTRWRHSGRRSSRAPRGPTGPSSSPLSAWASVGLGLRGRHRAVGGGRRPARSCLADDRWDASGRSDRRRRGLGASSSRPSRFRPPAICAIAVLGAVTTQRGWPQTSGSLAVEGLAAPATVVRDAHGIIQITADSRHDLFAQGYVHAQERMWQMELSRRIGAGRLGALRQGPCRHRLVHPDARLANCRAARLEAMSAESCNPGVPMPTANVGSARTTASSTPFVVAGVLSGTYDTAARAEPWTPLDTATWQKVRARPLGGNVDFEIFRLLADRHPGYSRERTSCSSVATRTPSSSRRRTSSATAPGRAGRRDRCRVG